MAAQAEPVPFVRARVADRQYRLSVLGEVAERLVGEIRKLKNLRKQKTLLTELREYLKQASVETGDWTEKHDHTLQPPPDVGIDFSQVPTEVLEASLAKMKEARAMLIEAGSVVEIPGVDSRC